MDASTADGGLRRPHASALEIAAAVVRAILLRDIKLLTGGLGLAMLLLMPIGHLIAVVLIFRFFGRIAPQGTDQFTYFGLSILPFVIFIYMGRQLIYALTINRPLLYFNRVKVFDILAARGLLESVNAIVVFLVILTLMVLLSEEFAPRDWPGLIFAVAATIYLTVAVGVANSLIAQVAPVWALFFNLMSPVFWVASGIIFFPTALPHPYDQWLAFNPLLQCVEWLRYSYYEDYPDRLIDIPYLLGLSTALLAGSLIAERLARRALR